MVEDVDEVGSWGVDEVMRWRADELKTCGKSQPKELRVFDEVHLFFSSVYEIL